MLQRSILNATNLLQPLLACFGLMVCTWLPISAAAGTATACRQHLLTQPVQQAGAPCQVADQQLLLADMKARTGYECSQRLSLLLFSDRPAAAGRGCNAAHTVLAVAVAAAAAPAQDPVGWAVPCW
jgi:hypothetical protein